MFSCLFRKLSFDKATLGIITIASGLTIVEAATRSSLGDAQNARDCRYPPLSSIVTEGELKSVVMLFTFWGLVGLIISNFNCKNNNRPHP
jgi:hypothetical protein